MIEKFAFKITAAGLLSFQMLSMLLNKAVMQKHNGKMKYTAGI